MQDQAPLQIQDLVLKTLGQSQLSGLSEMLKLIVEKVNAFGCILWQVAPGSILDKNAPSGQLFVLAQWFPDNKMDVLHDLAIGKSVTGNAIINKKFRWVIRREKTEQWFTDDDFLKQNKIESFCSVPIDFPAPVDGAEPTKGTLNLYRNSKKPFNEYERAQVKLLASLVPSLYGAIRDKVSHQLIRSVNEIFEEEFRAANGHTDSDEDKIKKVLLRVCKTVTDSLQCIETSIFLEYPRKAPGVYELMATTWPLREHFNKTAYKKGDNGLTGWVLSHATNMKIFDLEYFDRDKEAICAEYPGLTWMDSLNTKADAVKTAIREKLELKSEERLPPFSFMAVPIVKGKEVQGVIRCSIAARGPYYFAERELELLELVAAQISRYWSHREEITAWQALVKGIGAMNNSVYSELTKEVPEEGRIFKEALQVTDRVIKGADIMDVRIYDKNTRELYFFEPERYLFGPYLAAWNKGTNEEINRRRNMRFSINEDPSKPVGSRAFVSLKDPEYNQIFPDVKKKIVAPMSIKDEVYGVFDIMGTGEHPFPGRAAIMADLIGRQLGLYLYLENTVSQLRKTQADLREKNIWLERLQKVQIQAFENLDHQLKSPLIPALMRIQDALKEAPRKSKLEGYLLAVRGLIRKVRNVSLSARLFADLAREEDIQIETSPLKPDNLIKMLIEAAADNQLMIDEKREIRFHVERQNFEMLRLAPVKADADLLEQAIMNILENAGKYSFDGTEVRIQVGLTKTGRFHITVANKGLPIRSDEVNECKNRGWRSGFALLTTGEGTGIGLWIVDNIMKAHGGELIISPTVEKITKVQLVFPISQ